VCKTLTRLLFRPRGRSAPFAQPSTGMNSSRCRRMNSFKANRTIADGSGARLTGRFRQIHSSKTSAINCCSVMPRNSHCFVSHSKCCELTTMFIRWTCGSGSSDGGPFSLFCTHRIALEYPFRFKGPEARSSGLSTRAARQTAAKPRQIIA